MTMSRRMRATGVATRLASSRQSLGHNLADRPGATPALCAAAEAAINLPRRARPIHMGRLTGVADIVVRQNVAGTNNHGRQSRTQRYAGSSDIEPRPSRQKENSLFQAIPN